MPKKEKIAIFGCGKIGTLVDAQLSTLFDVSVYDKDPKRAKAEAIDVNDEKSVLKVLKGKKLLLNCCPHFCNLSTVHCDSTNHLYIKMSKSQCPFADFSDSSKCFYQHVIQTFSILITCSKFVCFTE